MSDDLLVGAVSRAIAYSTPILWLALGEIIAETAGVANMALDGMLMVSALSAFVAAQLSHSLLVGVLGGMLAGILLSLPCAVASITFRVNQYVIGLALAMMYPGVASLLGRKWVGLPLESTLPVLSIPLLDRIPFFGPAFFTEQSLLAYAAPVMALVMAGFFYYTRWGIIWRSAGESPAALDACGLSVLSLRYAAVLIGGLFAGIGGAYLSLYYEPAWVEGITGGMGWIAFAIVIFAAWNPLQAVGGALLFGVLYHFSFRLQEQVNPHILKALPYLFVVVVLIIGSWRNRKGNMPRALGVAYFREDR
jgi:ABC-type uncharacterized transport system permease subunit